MQGSVYPDYRIQGFIDQGIIGSERSIEEGQVQPASLDLRCGYGKKVWHMPYSSIPARNLEEFLNEESTHSFLLDEKRFLHKNSVYVIELEEKANLPEGIFSRSNPKSTTGRLDIHVRLMTENGQEFEHVPEGYNGKLFLELVSNSLDLYLPPGFSFNQLRFFSSSEGLNQGMLEYLAESKPLLQDGAGNNINPGDYIKNGRIFLTLDLDENDPGYKVRDDAPALDLSSERRSIPWHNYFEKVNLNEEGLIIFPNSFYVLKSKEKIFIPEDHCAEMIDVSTELGEFRAHYAGFFDPGFRSIAIMEVRNTGKVPFLLSDGQPISSLGFYRVKGNVQSPYGVNSNYQGQSEVALAKFFDMGAAA